MRLVQVASWIVFVGVNLLAVVAIVRGRRSPRFRRWAACAAIGVVLTIGSGVFGTIVSLRYAFDSTAGVDASRKATVLAEGISSAMNCTAFGLLSSIFPAVATFWISFRRPPAPPPA